MLFLLVARQGFNSLPDAVSGRIQPANQSLNGTLDLNLGLLCCFLVLLCHMLPSPFFFSYCYSPMLFTRSDAYLL